MVSLSPLLACKAVPEELAEVKVKLALKTPVLGPVSFKTRVIPSVELLWRLVSDITPALAISTEFAFRLPWDQTQLALEYLSLGRMSYRAKKSQSNCPC